mmetsp:Transcript_19313/g.39469  ORF Transcript_19313/g.39469 Transcript_19313/m.39469 type:complete len:213 (-) Transcript_19313:614-1252(-)
MRRTTSGRRALPTPWRERKRACRQTRSFSRFSATVCAMRSCLCSSITCQPPRESHSSRASRSRTRSGVAGCRCCPRITTYAPAVLVRAWWRRKSGKARRPRRRRRRSTASTPAKSLASSATPAPSPQQSGAMPPCHLPSPSTLCTPAVSGSARATIRMLRLVGHVTVWAGLGLATRQRPSRLFLARWWLPLPTSLTRSAYLVATHRWQVLKY